ncbi:MAG: 50S ribosomal protein L24 [Planctomycetota bacterium]
MRILKGDMVVVCTGDDSGKVARKVLRLEEGGVKIVVENVNRVYRHVKKGHPKSPQGGRLSIEMPIDASNVQVYCPKCDKGVRVGNRLDADGKKYRGCRKCGTALKAAGK